MEFEIRAEKAKTILNLLCILYYSRNLLLSLDIYFAKGEQISSFLLNFYLQVRKLHPKFLKHNLLHLQL